MLEFFRIKLLPEFHDLLLSLQGRIELYQGQNKPKLIDSAMR